MTISEVELSGECWSVFGGGVGRLVLLWLGLEDGLRILCEYH